MIHTSPMIKTHTHLLTDLPEKKQLNFQDPASPMMEQITTLHDYSMFFLCPMLMFVLWVLTMTTTNNNYHRNMTENTKLEIIWTTLPALMLMTMAYPTLKLLYTTDEMMEPELTIKTTGSQWYWSYEYSDYKKYKMEFESYMLPTNTHSNGENQLLEVNNHMMMPMNTNIRVLMTATDVLHSFTVPSLGMKADAIPGRLNQMSFLSSRPGIFYGQCSELCGANHSFMPIIMEATTMKNYSYFMHTQQLKQ